jgi:hypothetical protein
MAKAENYCEIFSLTFAEEKKSTLVRKNVMTNEVMSIGG